MGRTGERPAASPGCGRGRAGRTEVVTMQLPLTVTFHGMSRSDWIEDDIRKRAAKLETYCPDIMSCRVVVSIPHRHHETGNRFNLRIDLTVPGDEIAVSRESNLHASRKDLEEQEW